MARQEPVSRNASLTNYNPFVSDFSKMSPSLRTLIKRNVKKKFFYKIKRFVPTSRSRFGELRSTKSASMSDSSLTITFALLVFIQGTLDKVCRMSGMDSLTSNSFFSDEF